jgi:anti-sigma regulatory factor (Ser/Thr protein kinase)
VTAAEIELPRAADSSRLARTFLAKLMADWHRPEDLDAAMVCVAELVANAIRHADGLPRLVVTGVDGVLRCEVYDADASRLALPDQALEAEAGRGLLLVARLAAAWGVETVPSGKWVWFELRACPPASSPG